MPLKMPDFSNPNVRLRTMLYLGAVAIFLLFLTAAALPLASNSEFCGRVCHSQVPEYKAWQNSSHSRITCYACHINPSVIHLFEEKLTAGPIGIIDEVGDSFEKPINAKSEYSQEHLPSERCLRCHSPEVRTFTATRGLNVTSKMHLKHLDAGLQCATCHNRIAHLGAENYEPLKSWSPGFKYKNFMTMREGCWRCHTEDVKFRDEETLKIVGDKKPPTNCSVCHNPKWNLKPATGEYNHNDVAGVPWRNGKERHGKVAQKDFGACLGCHEKKPGGGTATVLPNCTTTCHKGITMPHNIPKWAASYSGDTTTPLWLRQHPWEGDGVGVVQTSDFRASDPQFVCSMCHNKDKATANFCNKCHHQEFDKFNGQPNAAWKLQHPSVVKEVGSSSCQRCHLLEFCSYCHTNGVKPDRGLFFNRKQ